MQLRTRCRRGSAACIISGGPSLRRSFTSCYNLVDLLAKCPNNVIPRNPFHCTNANLSSELAGWLRFCVCCSILHGNVRRDTPPHYAICIKRHSEFTDINLPGYFIRTPRPEITTHVNRRRLKSHHFIEDTYEHFMAESTPGSNILFNTVKLFFFAMDRGPNLSEERRPNISRENVG